MSENMHSPAASSHTILIRARALSGFPALVLRHGGDPASLLAAAALPLRLLDAPELPMPLAGFVSLLDESAARLGQDDFGLQLAQQQNIDVLGGVAVIAMYSASVGEAVAAIARNLRYHSPGLQLLVEDDPARPGFTRLRFELALGEHQPRRHIAELCLGVAQRFLRQVTRDAGTGWHYGLRHADGLAPQHYASHFSGSVALGQCCDSLSLPSRLLGIAVAPHGTALQAAAERHIANLIRRFPLDLAEQVEALVAAQLASGGGTLVQVARTLGLHERTLQRRLKEQSVFFEDIVDQLRRSRAEEYLAYPAIPLTQVAALLGYTEQSSFIRTCRRWFATTPQDYRLRRTQAQQLT